MSELVQESNQLPKATVAVSDEVKAAANALKDEGNKFLADGFLTKAEEKYTAAINLNPTAIFYSNRAMVYLKTEKYGAALNDANEAIALDPKYVKAYYRRASASFALFKFKEARKDFKTVLSIMPNDQEAKKKLQACEKSIREAAFAAAIESEQTVPVSQQLNVDEIVVDSSYNGPVFDPENPSMEFVSQLMEHFKSQKLLHRKYVLQILLAAKKLFESLPTLLRLPLPELEGNKTGHFTVCGDTHGQFFDLCNIFQIGGLPSPTNPFLFNGDYVDRGSFSFEVVLTLLSIKLASPTALHMLRGNHETKGMNKIYGFEGEVKHKYDNTVFSVFSEVFCCLPLCAVINDAVFVVHGGLSTQNDGKVTLDEIASINRFREPPESGLMSDLLWADPQPLPGRSPSPRGLGYSFGPDITNNFLATNNLKLVVRSHELKNDGYVVDHNGKCITVFSAPNYCDQMGNQGAFVRFSNDNNMEPVFTQFSAVSHPNVPPMMYAGAGQFGL